MDEGEARQVLAGERAEALVGVIEGAWAAMVAEGRPRRKRTRASIVNDHMALLADERLLPLDGVHKIERCGIPMYVFDERAVVRFKKHDSGLLTSNIPTRHQQALAIQEVMEGLPPEAVYLIAGYQLDRAEADILTVVLTKAIGTHKIEWSIDLRELAAGVVAPNIETLFPQTKADATPMLPTVANVAEQEEGGSPKS